jgi:hypothetical protein
MYYFNMQGRHAQLELAAERKVTPVKRSSIIKELLRDVKPLLGIRGQ